jgi:hypothetical protein
MRMNMRPGTLVAAVCIVVAGFAIGGWLAIRTRGPVVRTQRVTVAKNALVAPPARSLAARPVRATVPTAPPTQLATAEPTPNPTKTATARPTDAPPARTTSAVADSALRGSWQIDEANVQVGTIVWVGNAEPAAGNAIVFSVHKQSVGGRAATPCERRTVLRAAIAVGAAEQSVPYREVNCEGIVSTGEVRVTSLSRNGASFSGSFWTNGANLGTFNARKL